MVEAKNNAANTAAKIDMHTPSFLGEIAAVIDSSEPQREIFTAIDAGGAAASIAFNESMTLSFDGVLNETAFRAALEQLVLRYDSLRATFNRYGTQFCIHRQLGPAYRYRDASAAPEAALAEERALAVSEPFDLHRGPLFRTVVLKLGEKHFAAILTAHHIICDGWSIAVMLEDLAELYSAQTERRPPQLAAPIFYLQYLQRMRSDDYRALAVIDENFWVEQYRADQPVLDLPSDNPRPALRTFSASRHDRLLGKELIAAIKKTGVANKSSFVATLLTGFVVLLHKLSGQREIVIGMPAAGQSIENMERLIGHCVNTLPIRCGVDPALSFAQNLQMQRDRLFETYDHQRLTFGSLVARLGMRRDPSRIPLVPILYNIDQGIGALNFSGLATHAESNPRIAESFEIFLNATERNGQVLLECQYNADLYSAAAIEHWLELFENLLQQIARDPALPIAQYRMTTEQDAALWRNLNATKQGYARDKSVHDLLAASCERADAFVYFEDERITHAELNRRAGRLAAHLRAQGVQSGDFVGICMPRTLDMLIAMLAVLKAGAAYVPLDPDYPAERLQLMIEDSGLTVLLYRAELSAGVASATLQQAIDVTTVPEEGELFSATVEASSAPAYVIYTSGSTGRPKGVAVPHGSIVNFLSTMAMTPGLGANNHLLAVTTISFDIAVLELFLPLFVGADLTIASRDDIKDGFRLLERMQKQKIDVMQATPSTWRLLFAAGWKGAANFKVLTGGEALPQNLADELCPIVGEVWNMYGPTETTVWSLVARVQ
ncbi:MAG TPA: condensation domain-containing protein, partial [Spongiibacteraceae bacterium]